MKTAGFSNTLVHIHQIKRHHTAQQLLPQTRVSPEKGKFQK